MGRPYRACRIIGMQAPRAVARGARPARVEPGGRSKSMGETPMPPLPEHYSTVPFRAQEGDDSHPGRRFRQRQRAPAAEIAVFAACPADSERRHEPAGAYKSGEGKDPEVACRLVCRNALRLGAVAASGLYSRPGTSGLAESPASSPRENAGTTLLRLRPRSSAGGEMRCRAGGLRLARPGERSGIR